MYIYLYIYQVTFINFFPFCPAVAQVVCRTRNLIPFRTRQLQQQPETDKLCRVEEVLPVELGEKFFFHSAAFNQLSR